jgi:hypothetical protein
MNCKVSSAKTVSKLQFINRKKSRQSTELFFFNSTLQGVVIQGQHGVDFPLSIRVTVLLAFTVFRSASSQLTVSILYVPY